MLINQNFKFVEGSFDTKDTQMICVQSDKYTSVELCIKSEGDKGWNIPIAKIKLYSGDTFGKAKPVFEDAVKLCNEIARRWNECEKKL